MSSLLRPAGTALIALLLLPPDARAAVGGLPSIDPNSLVSDTVISALVNFVGLGFQHRPYEPATALLSSTPVGLDVSIEATLVKAPDSFFEALAETGSSLSGADLPSLPVAKLHLHKGIGEALDVGGSAIWLSGNRVLGADAKLTFYQAEEGPSAAFRFCYTAAALSTEGINVSAVTLSPQLLISRQMEFADPYLGLAYEFATGTVATDINDEIAAQAPPGFPVPEVGELNKSSRAHGAIAFGGVSLRVPRSGMRMTLEMAYNTAGVSSLGVKAGFSF